MVEKFADVNGIKICYDIHGKGYPVILIHGFGSKKESFMAQIPVLSQKFKIISFDNRGAGKSDRPDIPYTMEMFADDIRGLMDFLNIEKAHCIGFSLGGTILQNFVLKYPERVNKLVLINSISKVPEGYGPEMFINSQLKGLELLKQDPVSAFWHGAKTGFYIKFRKEMEATPKKKFYGLWSVEDLIKNSIKDLPTTQDIINQSNALFKTITLNDLSKIKNPTLLLAASHDRLTSSNTMAEMHKVIPNSTLETIDKAGHNSPHSKAPEINKNIIEFLKN